MKEEVVKVGDHCAFVVPAYLLVFGIWSGSSSYDYISSKWRTVGSLRRRGMMHLCALLFPIVYMIAYVSDVKDYKEMSGGLVALLFACIEFARTVVGLWQLHVLRHWVVSSIRSIESLGYVAKEKKVKVKVEDSAGEDNGAEEENADESDVSENSSQRDIEGEETAHGTGEHLLRDPFHVADSLEVNDLVIDNRLTEGEIECILWVKESKSKKSWKQRISSWLRWISCIWYLPRMLLAICHSKKPHFSTPESAIYLEPFNAEDIWMQWACVLVAQVFPKWLQDVQKSGMSDLSSDDGLSEQLGRFRRGVLCSAALHTQSRVDGGGPGGFSRFELNESGKYPTLCKGAFSLQEFLKEACETGNGLPFGVPHTKAKGKGNTSNYYSYSKFKSKLRRIREIFPVDDVERLEQFETCHLE